MVEEDFPADYDQRNVIQWSNQVKLGQLEFGLGYRYSSGLPYSTITDFNIISKPGSNDKYEEIYDGINNYRLPAMHEVNISALYNIIPEHSDWKAFLSFSITNLFNHDNIYNRTYMIDAPNNQPPSIDFIDKTNLKFTPNVSFRIEWY